jgi:hypothetical protein
MGSTARRRGTALEVLDAPNAPVRAPADPGRRRSRAHERRDLAARQCLLARVRAEFVMLPGMRLTTPQAMRLFHLPEGICVRILTQLTREGLLRPMPDGQWARADV